MSVHVGSQSDVVHDDTLTCNVALASVLVHETVRPDCLYSHCDSDNGVPNQPDPTQIGYCPTYKFSQ